MIMISMSYKRAKFKFEVISQFIKFSVKFNEHKSRLSASGVLFDVTDQIICSSVIMVYVHV